MNATKNITPIKQHCENHDKCMQMIQAVLDGSATEEERNAFRTNMDACMPCIEGYELQKSIKDALSNKLERKCCPENTVSLIKQKLGIGAALLLFAVIQIKIFHLIVAS